MSLTSAEDKISYKIEKLSRANFRTWFEKVKDYILALPHDEAPDIWAAVIWERDPTQPDVADPADRDYQEASNATQKKLRQIHNKAFQFIRIILT